MPWRWCRAEVVGDLLGDRHGAVVGDLDRRVEPADALAARVCAPAGAPQGRTVHDEEEDQAGQAPPHEVDVASSSPSRSRRSDAEFMQ